MKETTDSSISAQAKASTRSKALVRNPVEVQSKNLYLLLWWKELSSITNVSGKPQLAWDQASDYGDNRNRSRNWQTGAENTNSLDQERNSGIETEKHSAQGNTWAFQSVCLPMQETWDVGSIPFVWKIPWRRAWQHTPVFLPGESHGQRSLAGYSPWGSRESDKTKLLTYIHTHTQAHTKNLSGWS